ncbi:MAG: hypothetical protein KIT72_07060 [Polyangiaceae bacterium]|nr:hypothetical protein [Polyangiaceae bacterium]MCW5790162.1 hypothetical protein [Polyangiaceae bacterium]
MSRRLLEGLNGVQRGPFRRWLDGVGGAPRIAWYPSAGGDLRDVLYLSAQYACSAPLERQELGGEPAPPDLFLHTNYIPYRSGFLRGAGLVFEDDRTRIVARTVEELPRHRSPVHPELVDFPNWRGGGRVVFAELEVDSDQLGSFTARVLYVFAENTAFLAERALPEDARFSHVVHVRYGGGLGGGGRSRGYWLLNILKRVGCEVFVSDDSIETDGGARDAHVYSLYPELQGPEAFGRWPRLRTLPGAQWSNHGDVTWHWVQGAPVVGA